MDYDYYGYHRRNISESSKGDSLGHPLPTFVNKKSIKDQGFRLDQHADIGGTHIIGTIRASVNQLLKAFGEPVAEPSDDFKTSMEWIFSKKGSVATPNLVFLVYDYKNPPPRDGNKPHSWFVGGNDQTKSQIIMALMMAGFEVRQFV